MLHPFNYGSVSRASSREEIENVLIKSAYLSLNKGIPPPVLTSSTRKLHQLLCISIEWLDQYSDVLQTAARIQFFDLHVIFRVWKQYAISKQILTSDNVSYGARSLAMGRRVR